MLLACHVLVLILIITLRTEASVSGLRGEGLQFALKSKAHFCTTVCKRITWKLVKNADSFECYSQLYGGPSKSLSPLHGPLSPRPGSGAPPTSSGSKAEPERNTPGDVDLTLNYAALSGFKRSVCRIKHCSGQMNNSMENLRPSDVINSLYSAHFLGGGVSQSLPYRLITSHRILADTICCDITTWHY